jgi:hypothetical protein
MKYSITRFRSLSLALKELEPFINNGAQLQSGRPLAQLGRMLPREFLANWLLCGVLNFDCLSERYCFTSDPTGGDGVIVDSETGTTWLTEHVMVPEPRNSAQSDNNIIDRVLAAISQKQAKGGSAYASGKQLVVFLDDGRGVWHPNALARQLPKPLDFEDVWVIGLQSFAGDHYCYGVTQLASANENCPVWIVEIDKTLSSWVTRRLQ